jgi:predicted AlkP superfamily pyrophosphatase or phosphodiesterase
MIQELTMKYLALMLTLVVTQAHGDSGLTRTESKVNRIIFIGVDGLGSTNLNSRKLKGKLPNFQKLKQLSAWSDRVSIDRRNFSGPNWAAIFTGSSSKVTGVKSNECVKSKVPTIFDIVKNQRPNMKIDFLYEDWKPVTCYTQNLNNYHTRIGYNETDDLTENILTKINSKDFDFLTVYYGQVDVSGHNHRGNSSEYNAEVIKVDKALGDILDALEKNNLIDETLLILTSDHGHFKIFRGHSTPFHKVPLFIMAPGMKKGFMKTKRCKKKKLRNAHVAPIIAHFLGLKVPESWQYSVNPLLKFLD